MFYDRQFRDCLKRIAVCLAALFLVNGFACSARAQFNMDPSAPTMAGTDTITFFDAAGTRHTVQVPVAQIDVGNQGAKAADIAFAINSAQPGSATVNAAGVVVVNAGHMGLWTDRTGETSNDVFFITPPTTPSSPTAIGGVDVEMAPGHPTLAGTNASGGAASYTAGISFKDSSIGMINLSSNLSFPQLTTPTFDGLVTQEFATFQSQLSATAPSLIGDLSLNLSALTISFQFPQQGISDVTLTSGTTDVSLFSTFSVTTVPEPSSVVLGGIALLTALGLWWRRRPSANVLA